MKTVKVEGEEYALSEPTLLAWDDIFDALEDHHYDSLSGAARVLIDAPAGMFQSGTERTAEQVKVLIGLAAALLPLLRRSSRLLRALVAGCLRQRDGSPVKPALVQAMPLSRALEIVRHIFVEGVFNELIETVKNVLGPAMDVAQAAASESGPSEPAAR